MIPKVINYIWLGGPKPLKVLECIESWHRVLPDYQFNEYGDEYLSKLSNIPQSVTNALKFRKWAFVSDWLRLLVLSQNPGIYLDTDIFMVKPFNSDMLSHSFFVGSGEEFSVNQGVIGFDGTSDIIDLLLSHYESLNTINQSPREWNSIIFDRFNYHNKLDMNASSPIELMDNSVIYPRDYFYPIHWSGISYKRKIHLHPKFTNNTICIHLWNVSVQSESNRNWVSAQVKDTIPQIREFMIQYLSESIINTLSFLKEVN